MPVMDYSKDPRWAPKFASVSKCPAGGRYAPAVFRQVNDAVNFALQELLSPGDAADAAAAWTLMATAAAARPLVAALTVLRGGVHAVKITLDDKRCSQDAVLACASYVGALLKNGSPAAVLALEATRVRDLLKQRQEDRRFSACRGVLESLDRELESVRAKRLQAAGGR